MTQNHIFGKVLRFNVEIYLKVFMSLNYLKAGKFFSIGRMMVAGE